MKQRCQWCGTDPLYVAYHDEEWGVPVRDDRVLFELLLLEGAQAGLNWLTILKKRENYRRALDGFRPEVIARYDRRRLDRLMSDPGLVRNRLKIQSVVKNARAVLRIQEAHGGLSGYLWRYVEHAPRQNTWKSLSDVPAQTAESRAMSKDLKALGCNFVGPTICYAFMQAAGMVNDHLVGCFRHEAVRGLSRQGGGWGA